MCRRNGTDKKICHNTNCRTHRGVCKCYFPHTSKRLVVSPILPEDDT